MAVTTTILAGLLPVLTIVIVVAVFLSYLLYLRERILTYYRRSLGVWQRIDAELMIGEQSSRLFYLGKLWDVQPPRVIYFSEFLIVLNFVPQFEEAGAKSMHLALWPDSLTCEESKRLRRYLLFDLPASLPSD